MQRIKILFLYTELAGYFLSCIKALSKVDGVEISIIHWPVNQEAPFQFNFPANVKFYPRENYSKTALKELVRQIMPDIIYCSGWLDKEYLQVCKQYKALIPVIVGFDNQWTGSFKQKLAVLSSTYTVQKYFSHAWVPGERQYIFAKKMGFEGKKILKGFYSADFSLFHNWYLRNKVSKKATFPKRFIYVGRYVEHKGIKDLWQAFMELKNEFPNEWELWCIGTGPLHHVAPQDSYIKHFGFIQPFNMEKFIAETGVFILPSHFEPWGVVAHEFAAAGFPLVCSNKIGAAEQFLSDRINGYLFHSGNIKELKSVLKNIMNKTSEELLAMGEISLEKASTITPEKWTETLIKIGGAEDESKIGMTYL